MDTNLASDVFRFDNFRLDRQGGGLFRLDKDGAWIQVNLGSRAVDVLCVLTERAGDLVSKQAIMEAVWSDVVVEENNLTVQISALRRVLDEGRAEGSRIQTVPGRGYRFIAPVRRDERVTHSPERDDEPLIVPADNSHVAASAAPLAAPPLAKRRRRGLHSIAALAAVPLIAIVLLSLVRSHYSWPAGSIDRPRLSIVVLPFENLSGDPKDDYLAEGITDDLTSDLAQISGAFVIAHQTAYTYKGRPVDVRKVGEELGVRYVLEGSVRRIGSVLRVNAQLVSSETRAHLWSDRFDEQISELAAGQEQLVTRMRSELGISLVEIEKARSLRERPTNPDAFDLILRARALENQPPSLQRNDEAKALYERALERDPSSVAAMLGIAYHLVDRRATTESWGTMEDKQRAKSLLAQVRAIAPHTQRLLGTTAYWLRIEGRCEEAIAVAEEAVRRFPNFAMGYSQLGQCKSVIGHAEQTMPLIEKAIRRNPRDPYLFNRYRVMGFASLLLGRDQDAIAFYERSLAASPDDDGNRPWTYAQLAAAYARSGQMPAAKRARAEADRLFPFGTVRSNAPEALTSPAYLEQLGRYQDALRLAGERDHANEVADFGVLEDAILHNTIAGYTPTSAPGVRTIFTADLSGFLANSAPVIIDTMWNTWGRSLPGAVGLKDAGLGGSFTDTAHDRLRGKLRELTGGDLHRPIVAVGWNSERFDGRNLALRLVALGYTQVYWYRGGREAWEVNGLPETDLRVDPW